MPDCVVCVPFVPIPKADTLGIATDVDVPDNTPLFANPASLVLKANADFTKRVDANVPELMVNVGLAPFVPALVLFVKRWIET